MSTGDTIQKVLLINPPVIVKQSWVGNVESFPLGLAYIAGVLKQNHFEVKIIDCFMEGFHNQMKMDHQTMRIGMSDEEIIEAVSRYSPDLVGISAQFSCQLFSALHMNSLIKGINKNTITVVGGNHVSAAPESIGTNTFDWIIIGEGEFRLLNLIKSINSKDAQPAIPGVISASKMDKSVAANAKHDYIEDLDSIPYPLYRLLPLEKYWQNHQNKRWINLIATRGCPYTCVFCSIKNVMGRKVRYRSVDNVLNEILLLKRELDVQQIYFEDDNLTFNMNWAKELFSRIIQENLGLDIFFRNGIRADKVDLELLTLLKKAGARRVWFAPESGRQETLDKIIKKNMKLEDCENAVRMAKKVGLEIECFLVIGFPEETLDDIEQTIQYGHRLRKLGCDKICVSCASPYPGTELFDNCIQRGILSNEAMDYQSMSTMDSIIYNEHFSSDDVKRIRDRAMDELNRRNLKDVLRKIQGRASLLFSNPSLFIQKSIAHVSKS